MVNRKKASVSKLPSPCISVCQMDSEKGVCLGCFRTRGEIAAWRSMSEAEQIGLADRLAGADALLDDACKWAKSLCFGPASAVALSKSILNRSADLPLETVFALGSGAQSICYASDEHHDAVTAFLDKSSR